MTILHQLGLGRRTLIMGVLNITLDSFSDGGEFTNVDAAVERGLKMIAEGADLIDIGGESTRPSTFRDGAPLDPREEMARILPVIKQLTAQAPDICLSVDTYKSEVAEAALNAGVKVLNDISGLGYDSKMGDLAARSGVPLILMHLPGKPRRMDTAPIYGDIVQDLRVYFESRIQLALTAGVAADRIVIDPGIGFGKNLQQNAEILRRLPELKAMGFPILSGPSRKSFLGKLLGDSPPHERLEGTAAAIAISICGGADIIRVHDVLFMSKLARVCDGILRDQSAVQ